MVSEEYRGARQWSRDKQAVFTVVWISFLVAAIGTMVFFAGFFFFWVLCALCSGVTAYLVRTAPKRDKKHRSQ